METDMRAKKKILFGMEKENISTTMAAIILEIGSRAKWKGMENLSMGMEIWFIKDSGRTITTRGRAS